ncbi:uncharacterized protein LOC103976374 [Musa acuminata AAA Group]|uniref:uncharacterized protein LOC103976374 n=1 Tax=Musa acuminata AAA Group TaxID=214697 RepID=UPI0031D04957
MGICKSCDATGVAEPATAKLVLQDGKLQEFERPVKVSHLLQKDPTCFVCDSDGMVFDGLVMAVDEDDELQPGQLYFLLPVSMLRRPLHAEEMAALAVKASAALGAARGACSRHRRSVAPLTFHPAMPAAAGGGASGMMGGGKSRVNCKRRGGKGRDFASKLSAISE